MNCTLPRFDKNNDPVTLAPRVTIGHPMLGPLLCAPLAGCVTLPAFLDK